MTTFGEDLKQAREERKVSLEDISQHSKVGLRHLRALECDRFDQLPGGVFNKGIVRNYVRFLDLDEAPWLERFAQTPGSSGNHPVDANDWLNYAHSVTGVEPSPRGEDQVRFRWLGVAVLFLLLTLGGWFTYHFARKHWHMDPPAAAASWPQLHPPLYSEDAARRSLTDSQLAHS
jgi:cytoskeletal protein RodZ